MENKNDVMYWKWLESIPKVGRKTIAVLLEYFNTPHNIYDAKETELQSLLKKDKVDSILRHKDLDVIGRELEELKIRNIKFITPSQKEYPKRLFHLVDYPIGIYVKGQLPKEEGISLAVVGARNASYYGKEMARLFCRELAKKKVQVISGLAFGVDASAHQGALEGEGYTLGVLGCGINICYPKENYKLSFEMEQKGGIISEYGLYEKPLPGYFPMRNRIISAMADGILVIEAKKKSGSLITVDQGLELGRNIYAIPGKVTDTLSEGCNHLIQLGAKLVTCPDDILEDYYDIREKSRLKCENKMDGLVMNEKKVYSCLSLEPKYIDYIIEETGYNVQETISILFGLETKGLIKQTVKNYYSVNL